VLLRACGRVKAAYNFDAGFPMVCVRSFCERLTQRTFDEFAMPYKCFFSVEYRVFSCQSLLGRKVWKKLFFVPVE